MGDQQIPVLGVNLGKLGFLADTQPRHLASALRSIETGDFELFNHLMMRCQIKSAGVVVHDEIGLNELAVLAGPPFAMQYIDLYVDGHLATSYRCDGLIVSTPIGSTAHSLSAGGPILRKDLQAFVISPISPHTLTMRPVVDSADRVFELVVRSPNETTSAVLDGQVLSVLRPLDRVCIERARPVFQTVQVSGQDYYRTLREKLGWRGDFQKSD
jgi:NAD+ kinase